METLILKLQWILQKMNKLGYYLYRKALTSKRINIYATVTTSNITASEFTIKYKLFGITLAKSKIRKD